MCKNVTKYIRLFIFTALLLSILWLLEYVMILIELLLEPARATRKTAYPWNKAFLHAFNNLSMWQSRVFRFVFLILTGTLYQIVRRMPKRRSLTSDEMHVALVCLKLDCLKGMWKNTWMCHSVVSRMWNRYQTNGNAQHWHSGGHAKATSDIQDRYIGLLAKVGRSKPPRF